MNQIQQIHSEITNRFDELTEKQSQMKNQYKEYLEKNKINKVFGLDSFHYQSRLLDLEAKHLNEQYAFINNHMYCDYYKLYGMIKGWYKDNFKLEPKKRNYPLYKDLEQFKLFEFTDVNNLNGDMIDMLKKACDIISKKEQEILKDELKSKIGLNIDNYIYNHNYNNILLRSKMELYEKYLNSYHIYHMSFLSHLRERLEMLFRQNTNTVKIGEIENWVDVPVLKEENPFVAIQIDKTEVDDVIRQVATVSEPVVPEPLSEPVQEPEPVPEPMHVPEAVSEPEPVPVIEAVPAPEPVLEPLQDEPLQEVIEPIPFLEPSPFLEQTPFLDEGFLVESESIIQPVPFTESVFTESEPIHVCVSDPVSSELVSSVVYEDNATTDSLQPRNVLEPENEMESVSTSEPSFSSEYERLPRIENVSEPDLLSESISLPEPERLSEFKHLSDSKPDIIPELLSNSPQVNVTLSKKKKKKK